MTFEYSVCIRETAQNYPYNVEAKSAWGTSSVWGPLFRKKSTYLESWSVGYGHLVYLSITWKINPFTLWCRSTYVLNSRFKVFVRLNRAHSFFFPKLPCRIRYVIIVMMIMLTIIIYKSVVSLDSLLKNLFRNKTFVQRCYCSQISKDEVAKIVAGFENESLLTSGGVTIAGARYIYLSGTDRIIRAKLGKVGVHCMKTQQGEFTPLLY